MSNTTTDDFDLWADEGSILTDEIEIDLSDLELREVRTQVTSDQIILYSLHDLASKIPALKDLRGFVSSVEESVWTITIAKITPAAWALRYLLRGLNVTGDSGLLTELADTIEPPKATLSEDGKKIHVSTPLIPTYREFLMKLNARPKGGPDFDLSSTFALDFIEMSKSLPKRLPEFDIAPEIKKLIQEPLPGFDQTADSLGQISIDELHVIRNNMQSWKSLSKSKKTLAEKMEKFGIATLEDLIFNMPRKYIDKSKPQDVSDLIEGEQATIVGKIKKIGSLPQNYGPKFTIETGAGELIESPFFRQDWLARKFKVGDEVLLTGKVSFYKGTPQLGGTSIEFSDEASMLPIVPVYKQSESAGITTAMLLRAIREFFSRADHINLPPYFANRDIDYLAALRQLHLPDGLDEREKAIDLLAFLEMVYMQIIIQDYRTNVEASPGIVSKPGLSKLQKRAVASLPYNLTSSQVEAVKTLNKKLSEQQPSSVLLNADVGAGKSLCAQLACLRAAEAGHQAVIVAPTEILARQLYDSFKKVIKPVEADVQLTYLTGSLKAKERREALRQIATGEAQLIVGTQSVFSDSVEYADLAFVCFDEQQKFGAEQRSALLQRREDGAVPDLLMQSATPIPRSTAQVYYGDMDMIELREKPPGRLPIQTEWFEEDPNETLSTPIHQIWGDLTREIEDGNQAFVVTPMVSESAKVDASSVQKTYKVLSEQVFPDSRVGFVHGQMKADDQKKAMQAFRDKEYDVLVASTAVEVGVDIPGATRMVVLSADRFGASSLHQIRGRIGRNSLESKCYLVSQPRSENGRKRLQALVDSENGFDIAKVDLEIRGEGLVFGTSQSGETAMRFGSVITHRHLIDDASNEARRILENETFSSLALSDAKKMFDKDEARLV